MKQAKDMESSIITIRADENKTVSEVLGELEKVNSKEVLVFSDRDFKGVLSHSSLLSSRMSPETAKVSQFIVPTAKINVEDDLITTTKKFVESNSLVLPVFERDELVKIVDVFGLLDLLRDEPKLKNEIKSIVEEFQTVQETATLGEILHFMHFNKVKDVFVEDKGTITGMVSSENILKKYTLKHTSERQRGETPNTPAKTHQTEIKDLKNIKINNFTESNLPEVKHDAQLRDVANVFNEHMLQVVLVKDSLNDPIGIIHIHKFLNHIVDIYTERVENIFFQGLDELYLDEVTIKNIQETTQRYADKLYPFFNNIFDMRIHIKEHQKEGDKSRFQVFSKLSYPGAVIPAEGVDWDIITAVRKSLEKLKNQVESKYKDKEVHHLEHNYDISRP